LKKAAKSLLQRWADPVRFAEEALGLVLWDGQKTLLRSIARHKRTACRSGQKTGKSTVFAAAALWWALTKKRGQVVITAPSGHQVRNILWKEVTRLYHGSRIHLGGKLFKQPDRGWELSGDRGIICVTTDKPERMQGLSGANLLMLIDEGSGFPEDLWEPIFGNMAGGGTLATAGNPTRTSGTYFEAFKQPEFWSLIHLSSEDTPNARTGVDTIPGLATRDFIETRRRDWGTASAAYQVRILGNFPSQSDDAVVALGLVNAAQERWNEDLVGEGQLTIGIDVARFGDDESVLYPRRGSVFYECEHIQGADTIALAGKVRMLARKLRRPGEKVRLNIDEIGVGAGLVDTLTADVNELGEPEWEVCGINVAESPTAEGFVRLRDQLWFGAADWLASGAIPDDPKLLSELVDPTYSFDAQGRRQVESKKNTKKRLGRSPDRADAFCLAIYQPPRSFLHDITTAIAERGGKVFV
jgi:hypothetical protein